MGYSQHPCKPVKPHHLPLVRLRSKGAEGRPETFVRSQGPARLCVQGGVEPPLEDGWWSHPQPPGLPEGGDWVGEALAGRPRAPGVPSAALQG